MRTLAITTLSLVTITILSGAFVAGTDAGFAFNTFPLMDGTLVPAGYLIAEDVKAVGQRLWRSPSGEPFPEPPARKPA